MIFDLKNPLPRQVVSNAIQPAVIDRLTSSPLFYEEVATVVEYCLLNSGFDVDVEYETDDAVPEGDMNMNAYYDRFSDATGHTPISIVLLFSEDSATIQFDEHGIKMFIDRLTDALIHELIHAAQHRKRNYMRGQSGVVYTDDKRLAYTQEYLSRPDEIQAYSHNIASELLRSLDDKDTAYEYMRRFNVASRVRDKQGNLLSPNLYSILVAFDFDSSKTVIRRLTSSVVKYLEILDNE